MQGSGRIVALLVFGIVPGWGGQVDAVLQLGDASGENEITLELSAFTFTSTRTTIYSGTIELDMMVDFQAHKVTGFGMAGGQVEASDVSFLFESFPIFSQTVDTIDYKGVPLSPDGFETFASPGVFDANKHVFYFNEGRTVSEGSFGESESLVSDGPFNAAGTTTGTIDLVDPLSVFSTINGELISVDYDVKFSVSLDSKSYPDPGDETTYVDTTGTVTASGQVTAYTHPFFEWAVQSFPEAGNALAFTADANGDGMMDGISWALGQEVGFEQALDLNFQSPGQQLQLDLPKDGTRAPVTIQTSGTLAPGSWVDVADEDLSNGENPLPVKSSGLITISPSAASNGFFRLKATMP